MFIRLIFTMCINAKTMQSMPANNTNYSCYIKAVELVLPIIWVNITPLVINSLGGGHTHTNIQKSAQNQF